MVDSGTGAILAHYEYSPFGETIVATGELAKENPFRFSTKYTDDETTLVYYGYRFYAPGLGRWVNRDPLGEEAFMLTVYLPLSKSEKFTRDIKYILDTIRLHAPEIGDKIKHLLFEAGVDLLSFKSQHNLYSFLANHGVSKTDFSGLHANDDGQCCDNDDLDASKKLVDQLISNLLDQAKNLPGQAGEISKIIDMLKKIKDTGDSCTAMNDVANTCADFGRRPHVESCYACCFKIYRSYGDILGGIGHLACTGICTKFD